jgi:hypothetical protein
MKASELRIGNYHLYKIVDVIDKRQEWWESCKTDIHDLIILDKKECPNYAPIPLTEEWLLKLGFVSNPYQDRYEKGRLHIECDKTKGEICLWIESMPHIKYIHQLQNLYFALTGEELTI